jgi:hypothetical protein
MSWRKIQNLCGTVLPVGLLSIVGVFSPAIASAEAPPPPTVTITTPSEGATVKGTVTIEAVARAGAGDQLTSISFYDGVNHIEDFECEGQEACTATIQWEATGLSGPHTLTARADTRASLSTTSAPVTVTVLSPPPTVSITAPANGATVKGTVTISASGATDPSQVDYPTEIIVYDGINTVGSIECQGQKTCQGSVSWHATGLSGTHTLTAQIRTHNRLEATSPPVTVHVLSPPPSVAITSPHSGARLGGTLTVAVSGSTDPSQVDYPTSIVVFDGVSEIGQIGCQGQQSCAGSLKWNTKGLTGAHTLTAVIHTHTNRSATSSPIVVGASPQRRPAPKPAATASCHLATPTVRLRRRDHGVCIVHGAPAGTRVEVQYRKGAGAWRTAVRGHVGRRGRFHFVLHGSSPADYALTLVIGSSSVSSAARVAIGSLQIG